MSDESSTEQKQEQTENILPQKKNPFSALIPRPGYFITPIIIDLNILVWLAMVFSGASPVTPDVELLMKWGANSRLETMNGEWWRLFTCMFLHYGVIHLTVNMWAFYSIGRMLEGLIGKWRLLVLYLCSGLGASMTSTWWHEVGPSVGASGAIFGTFGIFAALLTTDLIRPEIRGSLLRSILIAIGINLAIGMSVMIDNSAHIGGLITGAMGGYLCYFDLRKMYRDRANSYKMLILSVVLTFGGITTLWMITPQGTKFEDLISRFEYNEMKAMKYYSSMDSLVPAEKVLKNYVEPWQRCVQIADSLEAMDNLTEFGKKIAHMYNNYAQMRLNSGDVIYRRAYEHKPVLNDSAITFTRKADSLKAELQMVLEINSK